MLILKIVYFWTCNQHEFMMMMMMMVVYFLTTQNGFQIVQKVFNWKWKTSMKMLKSMMLNLICMKSVWSFALNVTNKGRRKLYTCTYTGIRKKLWCTLEINWRKIWANKTNKKIHKVTTWQKKKWLDEAKKKRKKDWDMF